MCESMSRQNKREDLENGMETWYDHYSQYDF